jgi:hypothetical protein
MEFLRHCFHVRRSHRPATRGRAGKSTQFEAVVKDHSQEDADPYSPLMCILLLLMVVAATQFKLHAVWF